MGRPSGQCDIELCTVDLGEMENPCTSIDFAVLKIVWWIVHLDLVNIYPKTTSQRYRKFR